MIAMQDTELTKYVYLDQTTVLNRDYVGRALQCNKRNLVLYINGATKALLNQLSNYVSNNSSTTRVVLMPYNTVDL